MLDSLIDAQDKILKLFKFLDQIAPSCPAALIELNDFRFKAMALYLKRERIISGKTGRRNRLTL